MSFLSSAAPKLAPWKVLLVDDEPDIHDITKLTLNALPPRRPRLTFLHAYSGAEAKEVLAREKDIALVFLDVVMEREDSGLEVARWMRQDLDNQFTRIVLRTGQPGQAPEERVIVDYDINDYKEKTELDRTKLFTTTFAALRAYRDIMKVEEARRVQHNYREGLERVIAASAHIFQQRNLKDFASGLLQQVVALLRLEQSMLLRLKGASVITGESQYEVLARSATSATASARNCWPSSTRRATTASRAARRHLCRLLPEQQRQGLAAGAQGRRGDFRDRRPAARSVLLGRGDRLRQHPAEPGNHRYPGRADPAPGRRGRIALERGRQPRAPHGPGLPPAGPGLGHAGRRDRDPDARRADARHRQDRHARTRCCSSRAA
jgi:CheY-like chemotaxis protein